MLILMRKALSILLALVLLLPAVSLAETTLLYNTGDETGSALAAELASLLDLPLEEAEENGVAVNVIAADPGKAALVSQLALIEGLQGYTDEDVRKTLQLVLPLARSSLYVLCSPETADQFSLEDLSSLSACLEAQPFALTLMRSFDAGPLDMAALDLFEALDLETDTFADFSDCVENLSAGAYLLIAEEEQAAALSNSGSVRVLGPLTAERTARFPELPAAGETGLPVCQGLVWGVYQSVDADPAPLLSVLSALPENAKFLDTLSRLGLYAVDPSEFVLADKLKQYVDYMTEEGLFFYD